MATPFRVLIPARYASSRLPGKPLLELAGRALVLRVCDVAAASGASRVVVATDDRRIADCVEAAGFEACMTAADHPSGSDRLAEAAALLGLAADEIVVNLQGDEPFVPPALLRQVATNLHAHAEAQAATLATPITELSDFLDPNVVKVVCDRAGFAHYFSRAPIPWPRTAFSDGAEQLPAGLGCRRHLGIYAYRVATLQRFVADAPAPTEAAELLEQLRILWHGGRIHVADACALPGPGIDTPHDLERARQWL